MLFFFKKTQKDHSILFVHSQINCDGENMHSTRFTLYKTGNWFDGGTLYKTRSNLNLKIVLNVLYVAELPLAN